MQSPMSVVANENEEKHYNMLPSVDVCTLYDEFLFGPLLNSSHHQDQ